MELNVSSSNSNGDGVITVVIILVANKHDIQHIYMFWLCSLCFHLFQLPSFLFLSMHTFSCSMFIQCPTKEENDMGETIISVNNRVQVHPYLSDGHTGKHKQACMCTLIFTHTNTLVSLATVTVIFAQ